MNSLFIQPSELSVRGDWVFVWIPPKNERRFGKLFVAELKKQFTPARILSVGAGSIAAEGGRSDTEDLEPGDIVLVQHKQARPSRMAQGAVEYTDNGIPLSFPEKEGTFLLINQHAVVGLLPDDTLDRGDGDEDETPPGSIIPA
jgi:hypothetical protein